MGEYDRIFAGLAEMTGFKVLAPPKMTRRTLELGSLHSPETACVPFKFNLGNYIEALEAGADTLITSAGGCRFDYYFECHKQILNDLGYEAHFIKASLSTLYPCLKEINPGLTRTAFWYAFMLHMKKLSLMDYVQDAIRKRIGFEKKEGEFDKLWERFLDELMGKSSFTGIWRLGKRIRKEIGAVEVELPERPLRVGIVGELYLLMEPFSNFEVERTLGRMGVEVHRWVNLSSIFHHKISSAHCARHFQKMAKPYVRYHLGAHGTESAGRLNWMIKSGFDGAIHLKPFACMPEINAMPAMYRMSRDSRFPLTCFSFDSHTSESGVKTRLEAFYDMISHRREGALA